MPDMVAVYFQRDLRTKGSAREQIEAVWHSRIRADQLKRERIVKKFERLENLDHWPDHCKRFIVSDL
jgi:hypothetical protein